MRTLLLSLALVGIVRAAPFLVCDPYPPNADMGLNITTFIVTGISASSINVQATINADGSQFLHYDVGPLQNGTYTVTAAAVNGYLKESPPSSPFTFTIGVPATPTGIRLSPT
jgi:hypothetical protein